MRESKIDSKIGDSVTSGMQRSLLGVIFPPLHTHNKNCYVFSYTDWCHVLWDETFSATFLNQETTKADLMVALTHFYLVHYHRFVSIGIGNQVKQVNMFIFELFIIQQYFLSLPLKNMWIELLRIYHLGGNMRSTQHTE